MFKQMSFLLIALASVNATPTFAKKSTQADTKKRMNKEEQTRSKKELQAKKKNIRRKKRKELVDPELENSHFTLRADFDPYHTDGYEDYFNGR